MKIGNLPPIGERPQLLKWYFEIEIRLRPPFKKGVFQPWLRICCVKFIEFGEWGRQDGKEEIKKGGWKHWVFPWSIYIEITR